MGTENSQNLTENSQILTLTENSQIWISMEKCQTDQLLSINNLICLTCLTCLTCQNLMENSQILTENSQILNLTENSQIWISMEKCQIIEKDQLHDLNIMFDLNN